MNSKRQRDQKQIHQPASVETAWQLQSAKARFSELFRLVRDGEPQIITRQGRDAVVMMRLEEYEKLVARSSKPLIDFFRESPLLGADLDLKRSKDRGRDLEL